jgi:hypothetical protein
LEWFPGGALLQECDVTRFVVGGGLLGGVHISHRQSGAAPVREKRQKAGTSALHPNRCIYKKAGYKSGLRHLAAVWGSK